MGEKMKWWAPSAQASSEGQCRADVDSEHVAGKQIHLCKGRQLFHDTFSHFMPSSAPTIVSFSCWLIWLQLSRLLSWEAPCVSDCQWCRLQHYQQSVASNLIARPRVATLKQSLDLPIKIGAHFLQLAAVGPVPACHPLSHAKKPQSWPPPIRLSAAQTQERKCHIVRRHFVSTRFISTWPTLVFSAKYAFKCWNLRKSERILPLGWLASLLFCRYVATKAQLYLLALVAFLSSMSSAKTLYDQGMSLPLWKHRECERKVEEEGGSGGNIFTDIHGLSPLWLMVAGIPAWWKGVVGVWREPGRWPRTNSIRLEQAVHAERVELLLAPVPHQAGNKRNKTFKWETKCLGSTFEL